VRQQTDFPGQQAAETAAAVVISGDDRLVETANCWRRRRSTAPNEVPKPAPSIA
jgi:hypothetical protein